MLCIKDAGTLGHCVTETYWDSGTGLEGRGVRGTSGRRDLEMEECLNMCWRLRRTSRRISNSTKK